MKQFLRLLIAGVLLVPAVLTAASFEGKITFKMSEGKGKPAEMSYSMKGDKMRMEMQGGKKGGGAMIVDGGKKEMMMLMDEEKMYMTMAVPDAAVEAAKKQTDDSTLEKTSETERILGYTATKYISTDTKAKTKTEIWLAEGLGSYMGMSQNSSPMGGGRRGAQSPSWERLLAGKDLFPLRVVSKDKSDKETSRMEVTAIEKQKLDDKLFVPPADYQKFDMGGMMKGMIPGFGK